MGVCEVREFVVLGFGWAWRGTVIDIDKLRIPYNYDLCFPGPGNASTWYEGECAMVYA